MEKWILLSFLSVAVLTNCNDESEKPEPTISIMDVSIEETDANTTATLEVVLSEGVDFDISVKGTTQQFSADHEDFVPIDTFLTFSAGETTIPIVITILGDDILEDDESFTFLLFDPVNATLTNDLATVTITNDDVHEFYIPTGGYTSPEAYDGMTLEWSDEFNEEVLDLSSWSFNNGDGCDEGICGWGNNELQYYAENNTSFQEGNLVIEAREENKGGKSYTSSKLYTKEKISFNYGRIDVRAVMPEGQGMWPAIWMLGNSIDEIGWPECGEIDIMEMVGGRTDDAVSHGTVHWSNNGSYANFGGSTQVDGKLSDNFHVYSISWDENSIKWYLDDVQYHAIDISPASLSEFQDEFYLILNIAVGGNWPGNPDNTTIFPQWMLVDYVRYFTEG